MVMNPRLVISPVINAVMHQQLGDTTGDKRLVILIMEVVTQPLLVIPPILKVVTPPGLVLPPGITSDKTRLVTQPVSGDVVATHGTVTLPVIKVAITLGLTTPAVISLVTIPWFGGTASQTNETRLGDATYYPVVSSDLVTPLVIAVLATL